MEIKMQIKFKPLENEHKDGVISFFLSSMFKVGEFISLANSIFVDKGLEELNNRLKTEGKGSIPALRNKGEWLNGGVSCEILSPGAKGWQKGKVKFRVTLEFCPDEPEVEEISESSKSEISQSESPLDDIRRMIN